jgi:hypothetical protein
MALAIQTPSPMTWRLTWRQKSEVLRALGREDAAMEAERQADALER